MEKRCKWAVTTLSMVLFVCFLATASISQATWIIDTVDGGKCFTGGSMALDADGHPHIVYGGDHLYHAYYDGSTWHEEMIDSAAGVGEYARIVIDPNGDIHIVYYDYVKSNLAGLNVYRYATNAGGVWKNQALAPEHPLSYGTQMLVDASGTVHLIYTTGPYYGPFDLVHVSGTYGNWTASQIVAGDSTAYFTSCLDGSGNLHMFYGSDYYLHHRSWSAGSWSAPQVVDDYSDGSHEPSPYSCSVDADGYFHILHKIWPWIRYATNRSGSWQAETVEGVWNGGYSGVIATDAAGQVHIAFHGQDVDRNVRYAVGIFGNWNIETVDTLSPDGRYNHPKELSIQLEADGMVHLNYIDGQTSELKHAVRSGGSWSVDTVAENAKQSCMVIGSSDRVHLSYYDNDTGAIIYAIDSSGGWISETIASDSTDLPVGVALTTDLSGNSHMVYIDRAKHIMKYAKGQYGQWQIETFDVADDKPWTKPSLAADSTDSLHVAYTVQGQLRYATNHSGNMEVETLMDTREWWAALTLDGNDRVHIVVIDNDSQLVYFTNESGAWESQVLSTLSVSDLGGLQTDASGALHVVYWADDGTLYHSTNASGTWQTSEIGNLGTTYLYSIYFTIDTAGSVHVAYQFYSEATGIYPLGYATNASGIWELTPNIGENAEPKAICVNAVGQVCIVWHSDNWQTVGCALKDGSTWTNETIDQTDSYFSDVSVSTDGSGTLHLSYSDGLEAIKYAKVMPDDWTVEIIENTIAYSWNDITVDALGKVHIAYREFGNRNLKYATTAFSGSQDNVFDFPAYDGQSQLMLESSEGTRIESVEPVGNPSPVNTPEGIAFPYGFVRFVITGVEEGGSLVVTLTLEEGAIVNTYYKYGPTPDNPEPNWYEFLFDGTTGAVISGNIITLHFVDGQRGDYDLTANGIIVDPGAPGVSTAIAIPGDLDGDGDVDRDDLNIILSHRNQSASVCPECDLDEDGMITALDARKLVLLCTRPRCACEEPPG